MAEDFLEGWRKNVDGDYERDIESPWIRLIVKEKGEDKFTALMLTRKTGKVMEEEEHPTLYNAITQCAWWYTGVQVGFTEEQSKILNEEPI